MYVSQNKYLKLGVKVDVHYNRVHNLHEHCEDCCYTIMLRLKMSISSMNGRSPHEVWSRAMLQPRPTQLATAHRGVKSGGARAEKKLKTECESSRQTASTVRIIADGYGYVRARL